MNLLDAYKQVILEDLLVTSLKQGIVPLLETLDSELEAEITAHGLSNIFSIQNAKVDYKEVSSAAKWNEIQHDLNLDLKALYLLYNSLMQENTLVFDSTNDKLDGLLIELKQLEDRIENLLLLSRNSEGFMAFVSDTFSDVRQINLSETTAYVDLASQLVQANFEVGGDDNKVSRVLVDPATLSLNFNIVTRDNLLSQSAYPGSSLADIFSDTSRAWVGVANMSKAAPVTAELTIGFAEEVSLSKISLEPKTSLGGGSLLVSVQVSSDGAVWSNVGESTTIKTVKYKTGWVFPTVVAKWVKFTITKLGPDRFGDNNVLVYEFGFRNISFYEMGFDLESTLITKPLVYLDPEGAYTSFNKVALEVCEEIPAQTTLDYYVSFGFQKSDESVQFATDDLGDIRWSPIAPGNRDNTNQPTIVNVSNINRVLANNIYTLENRLPAYDAYRYSGTTDIKLLDHKITSNDVESSVLLLRNIKDLTLIPYFIPTPFGYLSPRGWTYDGNFYSCWVNINAADGLELDFGPSPIYVNGLPISGRYKIPRGLHSIKINKRNWFDLDGPNIDGRSDDLTLPAALLGTVTTFDLITNRFTGDKSIIDPLFPFNHKYLIEGLDYGSSYAESKVYPIVANLIAAHKMTRVSEFDLVQNMTAKTLDRFALINTDGQSFDSTTGTARVPCVRIYWPGLTGSNNNEKFILFKNSLRTSDVSIDDVSTLSAQAVILKVVFKSEVTTTSPTLEKFVLKLGN